MDTEQDIPVRNYVLEVRIGVAFQLVVPVTDCTTGVGDGDTGSFGIPMPQAILAVALSTRSERPRNSRVVRDLTGPFIFCIV